MKEKTERTHVARESRDDSSRRSDVELERKITSQVSSDTSQSREVYPTHPSRRTLDHRLKHVVMELLRRSVGGVVRGDGGENGGESVEESDGGVYTDVEERVSSGGKVKRTSVHREGRTRRVEFIDAHLASGRSGLSEERPVR